MIYTDIKTELAELRIPRWFRRVAPLYRLWMLIALTLGWFVFRLLLILIYGIVIVPIGLAFRLLGYDPLERKISKERKSYWITAEDRENRYTKKF